MKLCGNMETENMPLKVNAELAKQMDKSKKIYQEITKTAIFPILKGGVFNMRFLGLKTVRLKCGVLNPDIF